MDIRQKSWILEVVDQCVQIPGQGTVHVISNLVLKCPLHLSLVQHIVSDDIFLFQIFL